NNQILTRNVVILLITRISQSGEFIIPNNTLKTLQLQHSRKKSIEGGTIALRRKAFGSFDKYTPSPTVQLHLPGKATIDKQRVNIHLMLNTMKPVISYNQKSCSVSQSGILHGLTDQPDIVIRITECALSKVV